jgi:5-methylcytosine-specific restriction enzyme subunit McrC
LRRALRRGVLHGYRVEEDALQTVRGRIRFDEQLRRRFGIAPPVEVRFDEFTDDIEENRLLKAAIARLGHLPIRSPLTRRTLRELDAVLGNVRLVAYDSRRLPTIMWTRLNERYRPAVELARLILRATSFDLGHGQVRAAAFLLDMNAVFEDFVVTALRDELRLTERDFPQGAHKQALHLDACRHIGLQPDISWWHGPTCVFVGDVKYKAVRGNDVKHHDIYQLLAYTIATGLPGGLLIYAAGEEEPRHYAITQAGKTLEVVALDLDGPPDAILRQVKGVAGRVLALRKMAVGAPQ